MNRLQKGTLKGIFRVLACFMIMVFTFEANGIIVSAEVTEESIKAKKDQIKKQKEQRDSLNTAKTDLEKLKQGLEKDKSDLKKYISELDASLTEIQKKIDALNDTIGKKEAEIKKTGEDLEEAERTQEAQYDAMKKRIKFMYERGDKLYFELFVGTGSFSDMLNKAEYIEMIASYDRKKLNEYVATTELIALNKQALEEEKETLDLAKSNKEEEEGKMQTLIDAKGVELNNVSTDIKSKEAAIAEYEAEIKAENATIAALEKEVAADEAALNSRHKYDGGMFTFPCPNYSRVSDEFGMRIHPTLGIQKMHNGVDFAAPAGSAILAAYAGTVVAADYNGTMGNYIMINHGDGLYTIYMHCSALYVSKGQDVTAGTRIAAVGSTGRSTGNHLHFGVRLNGAYVSPWNYLK